MHLPRLSNFVRCASVARFNGQCLTKDNVCLGCLFFQDLGIVQATQNDLCVWIGFFDYFSLLFASDKEHELIVRMGLVDGVCGVSSDIACNSSTRRESEGFSTWGTKRTHMNILGAIVSQDGTKIVFRVSVCVDMTEL